MSPKEQERTRLQAEQAELENLVTAAELLLVTTKHKTASTGRPLAAARRMTNSL